MRPGSFAADEPRDPTRPWAASPFKRLARVHAASVAGDATFNVAMAGLVFLNVTDLSQARWRVAMALVFTVIPFSLAAPFIGPLIDRARGGRKWMIVGLSVARALLCLALVWGRDSSFLLYPEFLLALVCQKGYVIAKGAVVPTTVHSDEELVTANSKLSALSGIAAIAGGLPAILGMWLVGKVAEGHGPDGALVLGFGIYVAATILAVQLPNARIADEPVDEEETHELQGAGIRHASFAIADTRLTVGFLTFMLAFYFKDTDSKVGLVGSVIGAQAGFMVGAFLAPRLRQKLSEEQIVVGALGVIAVAGLLTAAMGVLAGATLIAFGVGLASNTAKQAFDALVQRDAPDANRGRAFARFETRFQLLWVVGALIPTAIAVPPGVGFLLIAVAAAGTLLWYVTGMRRMAAEARRRPSPLEGEPMLVEPRPPSRSFLRGRRPDGDEPAPVEPDDPTRVVPELYVPPLPPGAEPAPALADTPLLGIDPDATVVEAGGVVGLAGGAEAAGAPWPTSLPPTPPVAGESDSVVPTDLPTAIVAAEVPPAPEPSGVAASVDGPPAPPAPPAPMVELYDGADDLDTGEAPVVVRSPDPGPPSLVPPAAPVGPQPHLLVPPRHPDPAPAADVASSVPDDLTLTRSDGSFPDLPWRDAENAEPSTPPLPGFEHLAAGPGGEVEADARPRR